MIERIFTSKKIPSHEYFYFYGIRIIILIEEMTGGHYKRL